MNVGYFQMPFLCFGSDGRPAAKRISFPCQWNVKELSLGSGDGSGSDVSLIAWSSSALYQILPASDRLRAALLAFRCYNKYP